MPKTHRECWCVKLHIQYIQIYQSHEETCQSAFKIKSEHKGNGCETEESHSVLTSPVIYSYTITSLRNLEMIPEYNNVKYNKLTQMTKAAVPLTTIWVPCLNVEMPSAVCFVWIRKKRYGFLWGTKTDFLGIFIRGWNGHLTNTHIYQFSSYYHLSVLYTHSTKSQQQLPKAPCVSAAISDDT